MKDRINSNAILLCEYASSTNNQLAYCFLIEFRKCISIFVKHENCEIYFFVYVDEG